MCRWVRGRGHSWSPARGWRLFSKKKIGYSLFSVMNFIQSIWSGTALENIDSMISEAISKCVAIPETLREIVATITVSN